MLSQEERWLLEEKYNGERSEGFFADLKRLKADEPLAYIIGSIPFLDCTISLDSRPLIPRTETEFWVAKAIIEIQQSNLGQPHILDLCAGSGCIGIAVAKNIVTATVDCAEIDVRHIPTIQKNSQINGTDKRVRTYAGDLFVTEPPLSGRKYDFILSNPPYIDSTLNRAQPSVKKFEPHIALYGGDAGFSILHRIIVEAPKHLASQGVLYLEHEPEQMAALRESAQQNGFTITTHQDQYGISRYSRLAVAQ